VQESNGTPALFFQKGLGFYIVMFTMYLLQYQPCISKNYQAQNGNTAFTSNFFPISINNTSSISEKFKKWFSYQKLQAYFSQTYIFSQTYFSPTLDTSIYSNSPTPVITPPS